MSAHGHPMFSARAWWIRVSLLCVAAVSAAAQDAAGQDAAAQDAGAAARPQHDLDLRGVSFRGVDMRRANLAGADASGALFLDANVQDATFWRTRLDGADLRGARGFTRQQLSAARWDRQRPPKVGPDLQVFRRAWDAKRMPGLDLHGANWWGADLAGYDFTGADLRDAILLGADLRGAVLLRARVGNALLAGADISGADLRGAIGLSAAQLVAARWNAARPPKVDPRLAAVRAFAEHQRLIGVPLPGALLWLKDWRGVTLTGADLRGVVFIGADLRDAVLRDADVTGVVWTGADLSGADLRGARGLDLVGLCAARWDPAHPPVLDVAASARRAEFDARRLDGERLDGANFWGARFAGGRFTGTSLRDVVLIDADLRGAVLRRADVTGALFVRADISGTDLRGAKGFGLAQILSARWDPDEPPAVDPDLQPYVRQWSKKTLIGAGAGGANLWRAALPQARLRGVDLAGVSLAGADLRRADLANCDLRDAVLAGADISGADLRGARNLTTKMVLAATWDVESPPVLDAEFRTIRVFREARRFEFDLRGACLQGPDPIGSLGPARPQDRAANFRGGQPPHLGLSRVVALIRAGSFERFRVTR